MSDDEFLKALADRLTPAELVDRLNITTEELIFLIEDKIFQQ